MKSYWIIILSNKLLFNASFNLCLFCSWQCKSAIVPNTNKNSRDINPPPCCQCSSRWTEKGRPYCCYLHPPTQKQSEIQHTSINDKLLMWICNLIVEIEVFIPAKLHICLFNALVSAAFLSSTLWIHYNTEHFFSLFFYTSESRRLCWCCNLFVLLVFEHFVPGGWWKPVSNWFSWFFWY